jgi:hypothetical protein
MKIWILLAIAGLLLILGLVRERFEPTASIRAPPYNDAAKVAIYQVANSANQQILKTKAAQQVTLPPTDPNYQTKLQAAAGGLVAPAVGEFFTSVFGPATTPITDANVDTFMASRTGELKEVEKQVLKAYFVGQQGIGTAMQGGENSYANVLASLGQNVGYLASGSGTGSTGASSGAAGGAGSSAGSSGTTTPEGASSSSTTTAASSAASVTSGDWEEGPEPVCPGGKILNEANKCVGEVTAAPQCPTGYESYVPSAGSLMQCRREGGTETIPPTCPADYSYNATIGQCETTPVDPICPGGYQYRETKCMKRRTAPSTTTGGASTTTRGPTSGGGGRLRQVFGPVFTERGNAVGGDGGDSSQTNIYPELLGGRIDTSSRIPGAGVVPPSKNWTLANNGSLPTSSSLGSDELARYFPFSRMPGDMDVIPDPYRVAKTFSQASYSSKTEPTPFLTDFSAFQK